MARPILECAIVLRFYRYRNRLPAGLERMRRFEIGNAKTDKEYLKSYRVDLSEIDANNLDSLYEKHKDLFVREGKKWLKAQWYPSIETMLEEVGDGGTVAAAYIQGSRLIHLSAQDVHYFVEGEEVVSWRDSETARMGLGTAFTGVKWICTELAELKGDEATIRKLVRLIEERGVPGAKVGIKLKL